MFQGIRQGFKKGVEIQDAQASARAAKSGKKKQFSHSAIPGLAGGYYGDLKAAGIDLNTPDQLLGAVGARLLTDIGDDASRHVYWRYNHPMAIADKLAEQVIGDKVYDYNSAQRAAIQLAGVGIPVTASLGVYDPTNLGELGRAKGFSQTYAETGSEDRRETSQPLPELVDRFALGRRGRPLKFETAKEDIPDLTKERYANYMNFLYNDKGPTGLGVIKFTPENLEGKPEALIAGFPVGAEAVGALAGGAGATRAAMNLPVKKGQERPKARTVAGLGAAGAVGGVLAGKLANRLVAAMGQSDLPTTQEYGVTYYKNETGGITKVKDGIRYDQVVSPNAEFPDGLYSAGY